MKDLIIVLLVIAWACTLHKDDDLKSKIEYVNNENNILKDRLFDAGIYERR